MAGTALGIAEAIERIAQGDISSRELVEGCLARIDEVEPQIKAWVHLDREYALAQAQALDQHQQAGNPLGPLHGVPIAIKDIVDVADMPCELGSPLYAGRKSGQDATLVARLRQAGAVIMGKTVTTEFASYHPGVTTNPHDAGRTPGGSSSGSAAAVAAHMVPGAIGTQTNASIIRPASFCGVVGFKPSQGLIPRTGVMTQSQTLDTMGVFTRSIGDAALMCDVMAGFDAADRVTHPPAAHPQLAHICAAQAPARPRLAFVRPPMWDSADPAMQHAVAALADALGETGEWIELPEAFAHAVPWHVTIMECEIARNFHRTHQRAPDQVSETFGNIIERGRKHPATDYIAALEARDGLRTLLDGIFDGYDCIVTPAACGEAPVGLETTGNPIFGTIWTFLGTPAISLPLLRGANGMPMGIQLAGRRGDDARLLRTAIWLATQIAAEEAA